MTIIRAATLSLALAGLSTLAAPAAAQSPACADGAKLMQDRGNMVQNLQPKGKRKMTPVEACGKFNALVGNGTKLLAWLEQNAAWCNVPDQIKERVADDHKQAQTIRGQACNLAARQKQMEARARAQARQGGQGGDIVSGQMRVPQGAL